MARKQKEEKYRWQDDPMSCHKDKDYKLIAGKVYSLDQDLPAIKTRTGKVLERKMIFTNALPHADGYKVSLAERRDVMFDKSFKVVCLSEKSCPLYMEDYEYREKTCPITGKQIPDGRDVYTFSGYTIPFLNGKEIIIPWYDMYEENDVDTILARFIKLVE